MGMSALSLPRRLLPLVHLVGLCCASTAERLSNLLDKKQGLLCLSLLSGPLLMYIFGMALCAHLCYCTLQTKCSIWVQVSRMPIIYEVNIFITNRFVPIPEVLPSERLLVEQLGVSGFYHVIARCVLPCPNRFTHG